jgi:CRP/FNR family transcriptional regulator
VGGRLCLDFANTVCAPDPARPALHDWAAFVGWLGTAGAAGRAEARWLARLGRAQPAACRAAVREAVALRTAIGEILAAVEARQPIPRAPVRAINGVLAAATASETLVPARSGWALRASATARGPRAALLPIARSAALLIAEGPGAPVRKCANPACVRYFYDASRAGRRRWCAMAVCGNRMKVAAFARRARRAAVASVREAGQQRGHAHGQDIGAARRHGAGVDAALVRGIAYFRALPAVEVRRLLATCESRTLRSHEALFRQGEPCRGLYVVAAGSIEVRQVSSRGREQVFHTESAGATLGEGPLFDGGGYIASAFAQVPSRVLLIPRAVLRALCRRRPEVALAILETLARRVRGFAGIVADLAFHPVAERLARYLDAAARPGAEVALPLTQAQLAARLGTVRELVARALNQLEQGGVIARRRSRIVIRDRGRLAALARGETAGAV